ncbi:MAG: hypothetical protein OIF51_14135 [Cellvibrionaceae bacterium]|nr:hypothetical protein [Cellvibrionaceae bacterium]
MDELAVGDGKNIRYITTSHPGESEIEVVRFAQKFGSGTESRVEVVRI